MDPFDLMLRRPIPVKGSAAKNDFDFDEGLIDRVLGTPNKIDIPERYIPEREQLAPEEEQRRIQKAEAICRLLSKTSLGPGPLVLPPKGVHVHTNNGHSPFGSAHSSPSKKSAVSAGARLHVNRYSSNSQPSTPNLRNFSAKRNSYHQDLNPISSASVIDKSSFVSSSANSPVRRPVHSSLRKSPAAPNNVIGARNASKSQRSTLCDWSLAGVAAPYSPHNNTGRHSFLSSDSEPAGNLFENQFVHQYSTKPHHSYNSSYSSTSSGRSSSDKEDLLHLQHDLAKEVTQKSRLVAVRAVTSSPSPQLRFSGDYNNYRDQSPPSPVDLPTVQQREGFFT